MTAIKHFMWGFQRHFRVNEKLHAQAVFRLLDPRFDPEVFLVGVLDEKATGRHPACVEPEDEFWMPSESFNEVKEAAKPLAATYPESQIVHSHPRAQASEAEGLRRRAIRDIICKTIAECPTKPSGMAYFASFPVHRDGYLISTVLGLQSAVIDSHARLLIDRLHIHEYRSFKAAVSLIDAATDQFLEDSAYGLRQPGAGEGLGSLRSPGELLRIAGDRLTKDCAYKADSDGDVSGYWERLFDACNSIAALKYEQAAASGRIVVAGREHDALSAFISFVTPPDIHNARAARKLLELASRGLALHANAKTIFGLVEVGDYDATREDLFEVSILGYHQWELAHAGHAIMHVHSGQPRLPALPFDAQKLRTNLPRVFRGLSAEHVERIVPLVQQATREGHGTMLVIAQDAPEEAKRLANQATLIQPLQTTPELLQHLTPIDGAVLLGSDGVCHAIGVILDGRATPEGDPARGARFNSAVRYVQTHEKPSMAVVVSEDGGVDLIPDLRPAIQKSEIERVLNELRTVASETPIKRRRFNSLVAWLGRHAFYLSREHCEAANQLIKQVDDRLAAEEPSDLQIIRRPFKVDPGFDPKLYYSPE